MKFKKIFLFAFFTLFALGISAQSGTEKISISFQNIPLKDAMEQIEKASKYTFSYDVTEMDIKQHVSLVAQNEEIRLALRKMFEPTNISFRFQKQQIILSPKEVEIVKKGKSRNITGIVKDETGEPIIGATVLVKGTINGALTDMDGKYSIQAKEGETLEFRYIGYKSIEQKVKKENVMNVTLAESNINLDDVVVVGYGQQKKESVVASVNSLKPADIAIPTRSLVNSISGQIAGVIAIQRSGEPGNDDAAFWIRGQSSYAGGTNPLVLVDGVPRDMNDIDVDEIESFSVLKDAAATAVYGAEGANGVVLITSKRGVAQKTKVSFNAQYSVVTPTRMPELLDAYNYLSLYNEGEWNEAGNPGLLNEYNGSYSQDILEKYRTGTDRDLYPSVDWTDLLAKHTHNQRYTINFRGGSEKTRFFVSGAYYSEDGIFKSNTVEEYDANIGLQRYNLRSNVDMDITPTTKLSVDMSGQYKKKNNPNYSSDGIFSAITLFPTHLVPMHYSDGSLADPQGAATNRYNPYNLLNHSGYSKRWDAAFQSKVTLEQKLDFITKGLSIKGSVSFDADFYSVSLRSKTARTVFATGRNEDNSLKFVTVNEGSKLGDMSVTGTGGKKKIYIEGSLNYKRTFAQKHDLTGMILYNQKETQYMGTSLPYRKQNLVGRASYGYDSRYMLEASFGASGSENFSAGHRWGIFPAIGGAWYISHEKFMQKNNIENVISKLKLRASYGVTGNDAISGDRFAYREQLNTGDLGYDYGMTLGTSGGKDGPSKNGIVEDLFAAPSLTWEKEYKSNYGIDLGLFRGRVDISVDYFSNTREQILLQRKTIPTVLGYRENPYQNYGKTSNKGFDGSIILKQSIGKLNLSARGNFTYAKNKITEYDEIEQVEDYMYYTGNPIGQPKVYVAERLYTPNDFYITSNGQGGYTYTLKEGLPKPAAKVAPGDIKYKDMNNDGSIDANDMSYKNGLYPNNPQIVYGFGLNIDYKGFFAGIFFQGVAKASTNLLAKTSNFIPFYNGVDSSSARAEAMNRWTAADPFNQNVMYPRTHANRFTHNNEASTWWYRDASFLRLKNVEVGYQFDKKLIQKLKMSNLRIYIQGTNLAVWDHIKMWDPELGNSSSGSKYPICGTWTMVLEVAF